jgi:hypothetical protein
MRQELWYKPPRHPLLTPWVLRLAGDGEVKMIKRFAADGTEFMIEEGLAKAYERVSPTLGSKLTALVAAVRTIERTRPGDKCIGAAPVGPRGSQLCLGFGSLV